MTAVWPVDSLHKYKGHDDIPIVGSTLRLLRCKALGPFSRLAVDHCGDPTCHLQRSH